MLRFQSNFSSLLLLCLVYFLNVLGRMIFSPLAPLISEHMNLSHTEAGSIFLWISSGFAISLFSSQFLSARISHKATICFSTLFLALSLILASFFHSFYLLRFGLLFIGLGSGLFLPSAVAIISSTMEQTDLGKAFGVFAMAQSTAFISAPMLLQVFYPALSIQQILLFLGLAIFFIGIFVPLTIKNGTFKGRPVTLAFARSLLQTPAFWMAVFLLCLVNGLNVGIYNMAPHYFTHKHLISEDTIHSFIVLARSIGIIVAFLGGAISDFLGLRKAIPIGFFLCGIMTVFMGSFPSSSALAIFCIQAPIAICLTPMVHHFISSLALPEQNASVVSITAPFAFLFGAGIVPQFLGYFGDMQLYAFGFVLLGACTTMTGISFRIFGKMLPKPITVEVENDS